MQRRRTLVVASMAAVLALGEATALAGPGASVDQATAAQKAEAQGYYEKGAAAFESRRFDEAVLAFESSYGVVQSPNAHMMMARALIETGQLPRAYQELVVAEQEATQHPRYAATLERIRALRAELAPKVALVRVNALNAPSGELSARLGSLVLPLGEERAVAPGKVKLEILEGATVKATKDVELVAGQAQTLEIDLSPPPPPPIVAPPPKPPPPPPPSSGRPGYWIAGGVIGAVGLGLVGAGTGLYLSAKSDYDELEVACGAARSCPAGSEEQIESGRDKQLWSIITWVSGGAAAGLGIGLVVAGFALPAPAAGGVEVSIGPAWVGLTRRF